MTYNDERRAAPRRPGKGPLVRHRALIQSGLDSLAWAIGLVAALLLRFDLDPSPAYIAGLGAIVPIAAPSG